MMEASNAGPPIRFERTYEVPVGVLWDLWTTKEGFESWWGPQGFRVEVHTIEPRVGGSLRYDMIAVGAEEIEHMKNSGMATSHGTHGTFVEVSRHERLKILHVIDFIPGLEPYDNNMLVEFSSEGGATRMSITVDAHPEARWTEASRAGMESQLAKLPAVLAARAG